MPRRPLWADEKGLHVVYADRQRGIVRETLSPETGQEVASEADAVFPTDLRQGYSAIGIGPIATSPQADMAISFGWMSEGSYFEKILLVAGEKKTILEYPWIEAYNTMGFGWDGEGFTVIQVTGDRYWVTARFTVQGEMIEDVTEFGQAVLNYGQYDVEVDPTSGTTVFVGASSPGVAISGRHGRYTSLTEPSPYWVIGDDAENSSGLTPAVALHGDTALIAWSGGDHMVAREVSLPGGQASAPWTISTDPGNFFKQVAAVWAKDHWVVVGQDYRGLVFAEIGSQGVKQRRLLNHVPAACAATNTCPSNSSDWRWTSAFMTVAAYGDSAWVGLVDYSTQRVENHLTLYTYRILPLRDGCTFQSLASQ